MKKYLRILTTLLLTIMLTACNDQGVLFNLTQVQANQVLAILLQHNITASKEGNLKAGYMVSVPTAESTAALSIINQYQLPWAADVQIAQAFPEGGLVDSPNAEQARVLSLEEQRLEQSLRMIDHVVNARVHISYPIFNSSLSDNKSVGHVAVLISYKGDINSNLFISQIKTLIKNSFENVNYDNVSVVLFPTTAIQYSAPTQVPTSIPLIWDIFFVFIGLGIVGTGGFMLYTLRRRTHNAEGNAAQLTEDDNDNSMEGEGA